MMERLARSDRIGSGSGRMMRHARALTGNSHVGHAGGADDRTVLEHSA